MHSKFRFEEAPDGATRVLICECELDAADAAALRDTVDAALAAGKQRVIVDLSEATYIETAVVAALLDANARARRFGARLCVVVKPDSRVRSVFDTSRLDRILSVVATRQDALGSP